MARIFLTVFAVACCPVSAWVPHQKLLPLRECTAYPFDRLNHVPLRKCTALSAVRNDKSSYRNSGSSSSPSPYEQEKLSKLLLSILIDVVGFSSYALPALGEAGDVAWAPISAALIQFLYGNIFLSGLGLVEELLPGADFIPTATIAWFLSYKDDVPEPQEQEKEEERQTINSNNADFIDVEVK